VGTVSAKRMTHERTKQCLVKREKLCRNTKKRYEAQAYVGVGVILDMRSKSGLRVGIPLLA
jgi:hypothetical protein